MEVGVTGTQAPDPADLAVLVGRLYTSCFKRFPWDEALVPVQIASKPPMYYRREQHAQLKKVLELAPDRPTLLWPQERFHAAYIERIETHAAEAFAKLADLARGNEGKRLVLMCFEERATKCHRSEFSAWALERFGLVVPELDLNAAPAASSAQQVPEPAGASTRDRAVQLPQTVPARTTQNNPTRQAQTLDEKFEAAGPATVEVRRRLHEVARSMGLTLVPKPASEQLRDGRGVLVSIVPFYKNIELPMGGLGREQVHAMREEIFRIDPRREPAVKYPSIGCSQALEHWEDVVALLEELKRARSGRN